MRVSWCDDVRVHIVELEVYCPGERQVRYVGKVEQHVRRNCEAEEDTRGRDDEDRGQVGPQSSLGDEGSNGEENEVLREVRRVQTMRLRVLL